ncbi:MAG: hypothetical protein ACK5NE_01945 [Brachymonas sp.]
MHLDIAHVVDLRQALRPENWNWICVWFRHAIGVRVSCGHSGTSPLLPIASTQGGRPSRSSTMVFIRAATISGEIYIICKKLENGFFSEAPIEGLLATA